MKTLYYEIDEDVYAMTRELETESEEHSTLLREAAEDYYDEEGLDDSDSLPWNITIYEDEDTEEVICSGRVYVESVTFRAEVEK